MRKLACLLIGAACLANCARPYAPPGGDPDRLPPALVTTTPAPFEVLRQLDQPVVFRFDERLRTRTFTRALVSVSPGSPETIEFDVKGNEVRIRQRGGWTAGQIYNIVLRPGVEDMFNNRRTRPAELIFSTGPQVPPSALGGLIEDRLTGRPAKDAAVEAMRRSDSTVYRAWADTSAFFVLRHIPYGTYDLLAFGDANRNGRRDGSESRQALTATVGPGQDTVQVFFVLLPNDTTPPRALRAEPIDSLQARITFDDSIDPDSGLVAATAAVFALPDSTPWPGTFTLQLEAAATAAARARRAAADSAAADSAARARAAADTTRRAAPRPRPATPPATVAPGAPTRPVPEKVVVLGSDTPMRPGTYVILVSGVRNVNGLAGGGSARLTVRPAAARPGAPPDTTPQVPRTR